MGGQKPVQPTEQKGASFVDQEPNMQSYFDALHSSHEEMAAQPSWRSFSLARRAHTALASVALEATYMEMSAMGQFSSQEPDSPVIMQPLVRQRWQSFPYEAQVSVTLGHCSRGMHRPFTSREYPCMHWHAGGPHIIMQGANGSSPHLDSHIDEHWLNCSPGGQISVGGVLHLHCWQPSGPGLEYSKPNSQKLQSG